LWVQERKKDEQTKHLTKTLFYYFSVESLWKTFRVNIILPYVNHILFLLIAKVYCEKNILSKVYRPDLEKIYKGRKIVTHHLISIIGVLKQG
jgi:hypothetical protein